MKKVKYVANSVPVDVLADKKMKAVISGAKAVPLKDINYLTDDLPIN